MSSSSPHGSRIKEAIRYLANRFLTDSQRKRIKNFLARVQRIPLKVLGVESLIQSQSAEIERLKSRLTLLDGKLNIAFYGMPQLENKLRAVPMSSSLLQGFDLDWEGPGGVSDETGFGLDLSWMDHPFFEKRKGATALIAGDPSFKWISRFSDKLGKLERLFLNFDKDFGGSADDLALRDSGEKEILSTDPIAALMALADWKLDWIVSVNRFQRLSPYEQIHYLKLSVGRLKPGGVLCLILPNLKNEKVWQDLYWSDPRNLRPYSVELLKQVLGTFPGRWELGTVGGGGSPEIAEGKELQVLYRHEEAT